MLGYTYHYYFVKQYGRQRFNAGTGDHVYWLGSGHFYGARESLDFMPTESSLSSIDPPAISEPAAKHFGRGKNSLLNRSRKNLRRDVGRAISDYNMIEEGDLVMVCLSGGKDSYAMLDILLSLQKHAPIEFKLHAVNLDQKQPDFPKHVLPAYLDNLGVDYTIIEKDTYSIVTDKVKQGKTYCGLCSRLRRGILYNHAQSIGATKIALGHHRDDIVETLFLNMFYGGKLKEMPPKLLSDDKRNIVIRPLAYCKEKEISRYAQLSDFPIIP